MPLALAWEMWQNKAEIPLWMPWITSVTVRAPQSCSLGAGPLLVSAHSAARAQTCVALLQVQADDPRMSRWALSTVQFGQTLEFAWLARDLTPITNQKARPRCTPRAPPRR